MADTTVKIDEATRDILRELADAQGLSIKEYLARLAVEHQRERALTTATAAFRRVISEPGVQEAFDAEFGGLPPVTEGTGRVA
ncbi:antitoxin MazE7 [Streptomyces sp. NPDC048254]|uniref:antitoxin MazE7 n=1 Tax=Streptomyces sp. NPDC048254 TaxID=3365525 RepID=UPI0037142307